MDYDLPTLKTEKQILETQLSDPAFLRNQERAREAGRRLAVIDRTVTLLEDLSKLDAEEATANELRKGSDRELTALAEEDLIRIKHARAEKQKKLTAVEAGDEEKNAGTVIMEIRAGTGGDEAALFAAELIHMYLLYAKNKGWKTETINTQTTSIGGIKEAAFEISGNGVFDALRFESGVHRVQRIPETEKTGRIHTSTASVAVLLEAEEKDVEIKPQEIKYDFFRVSGPGGQNVNKVETGVRITHLPTGVVVSCQESRSQQKNRERALTLLRTKILDEQRRKEAEKVAKERREQIGTAERVEKIRTYNFPQDRITDHRIKENFHNINSILEGNLDSLISALQSLQLS